MTVFISWSGIRSERVAQELDKILRLVDIAPWLSDNEIEKGMRWREKLTEALKTCEQAIVCVTAHSMTSKWVMFEVGMLMNSSPTKKIVPLLIDLGEDALRDTPLEGLQFTRVQVEKDIKKLLIEIRHAKPYDELSSFEKTKFDNHFNPWWHNFIDTLNNLPTEEQEAIDAVEKLISSQKRNTKDILLPPLLDKIEKECDKKTLEAIAQEFLNGRKFLATDTRSVLDALMQKTTDWIRSYLEREDLDDRHYQILVHAGLIAIAIIAHTTDHRDDGRDFLQRRQKEIASNSQASYVETVLKTTLYIIDREEKPSMSHFGSKGY